MSELVNKASFYGQESRLFTVNSPVLVPVIWNDIEEKWTVLENTVYRKNYSYLLVTLVIAILAKNVKSSLDRYIFAWKTSFKNGLKPLAMLVVECQDKVLFTILKTRPKFNEFV